MRVIYKEEVTTNSFDHFVNKKSINEERFVRRSEKELQRADVYCISPTLRESRNEADYHIKLSAHETKRKGKRPIVRKRLNIPEDATDVLDWMDAQSDAHISIQMLILNCIEANGFTDLAKMPSSRTALKVGTKIEKRCCL